MAQRKHTVQAGQLLNENGSTQVYSLETDAWYPAGPMVGRFEQVTAAFSDTHVAVRVSRGQADDLVQDTQVVISRDTFLSLLASYRAFERAEKKRAAETSDPFLDDTDLP